MFSLVCYQYKELGMKVDVRLLIIILMLFSLLISYKSFSQNWDVIYRADEMPEKAGWKIDKGFGADGQKRAIIKDPDNQFTNKLLHIDDSHAGQRIMWFRTFKGEGNPPGITIVARVKSLLVKDQVKVQGNQERNIGFSDGINPSDEVIFWPDRVQLGIGLPVGEVIKTHKLKGDEWHTYRVTSDESGVIRVYVDGLGPVLEMVGGIAADHWRALHLTKIGDKEIGPSVTIGVAQAHDSVQDLYFDYVLVDFSGARPPGGGFPRDLIREYLPVEPSEKIATRWATIKLSE